MLGEAKSEEDHPMTSPPSSLTKYADLLNEEIVDVVDAFDPRMIKQRNDLLALKRSRVITYYGMSNALKELVKNLGSMRPGTLRALRVWGHGTPGVAGLAIGTDPRMSREHLSGFSLGSLSNPMNPLWALQPVFSPGGRIEFRTCQTGGGADGEALAKLLATKLKVHVYMSIVDTHIENLAWTGPVLHCDPQGNCRSINAGQAPRH